MGAMSEGSGGRGYGETADERAEQQRRLEALRELAARQPQLATQVAEKTPAQDSSKGEGADPAATSARTVGRGQLATGRVGLKQRIAIGLSLVAMVAAVAGGITLWRAHGSTSTQQPTGPKTVGVISNINFGTLTVNGQKIAGSLPVLVHFHAGANTVTLSAPPFRARTCTFTYPSLIPSASTSGHACGSPKFTPPMLIGDQSASDGVVDVLFDGSDLADAQRSAAQDAITKALAALQLSTHVPAGDYFATGTTASGGIQTRRATQPLQATLVAAPLDPSQAAGLGGLLCPQPPCAAGLFQPEQYAMLTGPTWIVAETLGASLRFTAADGRLVATTPVYPIPGLFLTLVYDAPSPGWHYQPMVSPITGVPDQTLGDMVSGSMCNPGMDALTHLLQPAYPSPGQQSLGFRFGGGSHPLEGCTITLIDQTGHDKGAFVWRFGVLLAADAPAHQLLPALPMAPAADLSAIGASG
jgi:hypothetical protein